VGRDVLHCPYCHGHEVQDRQLGVIGGTPGAVRYAQIVRQWTHDLVYFTPPDTLTYAERSQLVARAIGVIEGDIDGLVIDDDQLLGVQMADGCVVPRDALFVPPRFVPNNHLLLGVGCNVDENGWATADATGRTSVPGVWVAGNVVDPRAQVITAAGAGSTAAIALNADLVEDDVSIEAHHELTKQQHAYHRHRDWDGHRSTGSTQHFSRGPDTRLHPLDLPASPSPGLQRASDRPNHRGPLPCGLLGIWRRQPHSDGHRPLR
jgi:hypothetical protein